MRLAEKCSKTACLQAKGPKWLDSAAHGATQAGFPRLSGENRRFRVPRETLKPTWGR